VADHFGIRAAFYALSAVGLLAVLLVLFAMPETRPSREAEAPREAEAQ
jgi:predicted MFS family arabinose efflux permease